MEKYDEQSREEDAKYLLSYINDVLIPSSKNNHRHPLIESKKSGNGHRYSYFLDQIMVGLLGLDELAEVFQCQLHTFSGKRQKHPASTYSVCSDFRLSI